MSSRLGASILGAAFLLPGCADAPRSREDEPPRRSSVEVRPPVQLGAPPRSTPPPSREVPRAPRVSKPPIEDPPSATGDAAPAVPPGQTSPPAPVTPRPASKEALRSYLARLQSKKETGDETLRELWEVEANLIPDLILELENPAPTELRELKIFIPDREQFAKKSVGLDAKGQKFVYEVPGMGAVAYDDLATGPARGKSVKVILKRFGSSAPFTVGEVLRSALLNRFRSSQYPSGDHRSNLIGWWQQYYAQVRGSL